MTEGFPASADDLQITEAMPVASAPASSGGRLSPTCSLYTTRRICVNTFANKCKYLFGGID